MNSQVLTIVATGVANLASVQALSERLGMEPAITSRPQEIEEAAFVLVPGVGAFGPAMEVLRSSGADEALRRRVAEGRPTMAICLGMQLFFEESEESAGVCGLGIIPGKVRRLADKLPLPQLGWNRIVPSEYCRILTGNWAYFANSYAASLDIPAEIGSLRLAPASASYQSPFLAALEGWKDDRAVLLLCQFHPELSGPWGTALVRRWLEGGIA